MITTAVSMILSALYPRFRDMVIIWTVARTALFYATPVLYPLERGRGPRSRDVIALNPLTPMFALARKWVIDPDAPGPGRGRLGAATGGRRSRWRSTSTICVLSVVVFLREAPRIAEEL